MKTIAGLFLFLLLAFLNFGCGPESREAGRVLVLGLDGMDPEIVDLLMSEGKLPNFARLRQDGAYGRLQSRKPLLSPVIWTTVATGKTADQHGIGHFVAIDRDSGERMPVTSDLRRVKALWGIASDAGKRVATVGWWATWPPEEIDGFVVSDHVAYHFLFENDPAGDKDGRVTWPQALLAEILPMLKRPQDLTRAELSPFVRSSSEKLSAPFDFEDDLSHFRWALATARSYRDIGLMLWREKLPDLELVYIEGLDSASHLFGHLFRSQGLGGELARQQEIFGQTVEEMYLFADRLVGQYLDALGPETTLVVLSDHGFRLGVLHEDPSKTRDLRRVSERFHRIEGILYLFGRGVKPGSRIERATILDITPTLLTLLGLPSATDMPGRVLTEALLRIEPKARISTYEASSSAREPNRSDSQKPAVEGQLEHLRSLGYLGGASGSGPGVLAGAEEPMAGIHGSPASESLLAAIQFESGSYEEAVELYARQVEARPDKAALRTSYAGALGALGRYEEALNQVAKAIELDPVNPEAYHNRAAIYERLGKPEAAIAAYRTAVRCRPDYEPSREALLRLTGTADLSKPRNDSEARAANLLTQAANAARRTNFDEAARLLDAAETAAPGYVLVYQYRSNVAYLMGDRETAIRALERALELEPDNALFLYNLAQLRENE